MRYDRAQHETRQKGKRKSTKDREEQESQGRQHKTIEDNATRQDRTGQEKGMAGPSQTNRKGQDYRTTPDRTGKRSGPRTGQDRTRQDT